MVILNIKFHQPSMTELISASVFTFISLVFLHFFYLLSPPLIVASFTYNFLGACGCEPSKGKRYIAFLSIFIAISISITYVINMQYFSF